MNYISVTSTSWNGSQNLLCVQTDLSLVIDLCSIGLSAAVSSHLPSSAVRDTHEMLFSTASLPSLLATTKILYVQHLFRQTSIYHWTLSCVSLFLQNDDKDFNGGWLLVIALVDQICRTIAVLQIWNPTLENRLHSFFCLFFIPVF